MGLSIESTLGELMANPDAKAILVKHLPSQVVESEKMTTVGVNLTLGQVAAVAPLITDEMVAAVAADLEALGA